MHYTITCATCHTSTHDQVAQLVADAPTLPAGATPSHLGCADCPSRVEAVKADDGGVQIVRHLPEDSDVLVTVGDDGNNTYALASLADGEVFRHTITITQRLEDVNLEDA